MTEIYDINHAVNSFILVVVSKGSVQKYLCVIPKLGKKYLCSFHPNICTCMPSAKKSTYICSEDLCGRTAEICHLSAADYMLQNYRILPFICSR